MKDYLRIAVEVLNNDIGENGLILARQRLFPLEYTTHERYHSFLTMQTLDLLRDVRVAHQEYLR